MHGLHFFVVPLHGILKSTTSIYDYLSSVIGRTYIKVCPYKILFTQKHLPTYHHPSQTPINKGLEAW